MRRRFLYGSGIVLLLILATLVIWQVSFRVDESPANLNQTVTFWAVSTLVFSSSQSHSLLFWSAPASNYISPGG